MASDAPLPAWSPDLTPQPDSVLETPDPVASSPRVKLPEAVRRSKVRWAYLVPNVTLHVLALLACLPWLFTWTGLIALLVGVPLFGQGINLCYHRLLSHRSFRVPRWFEHWLVAFALCSLEDTPISWVTTHRIHHGHSDERPDPHTPLVNFFWGHVGWLWVINRDTHCLTAYHKYARDLVGDRFYRRLEAIKWLSLAIYLAHAAVMFAIGAAIGFALHADPLRTGLSVLVWGVVLRTVVVWHVTWSVNSLTHLFGYRNYDTTDNSRNNWLVGLFGSGEGWHNNHHHDPVSATVQHRWWEIDLTYYVIKLLAGLGLASHIVPPRAQRQARHAQQ